MWNKLNPYWKDILIALVLYLPLTVYTLCWPPSIGLLTLPFLEDVALANYILLLIPTLLAWLCSWKMSSVRPYFVSGISLTMNLGLYGGIGWRCSCLITVNYGLPIGFRHRL